MIALQHISRRRSGADDGTILVGPTRYTLDAAGMVEVAEADAALMLQGANWSRAPKQAAPAPAEAAPVTIAAAATPAVSAEEAAEEPPEPDYATLDTDALRERAERLGINLPRASRLALISALRKAER